MISSKLETTEYCFVVKLEEIQVWQWTNNQLTLAKAIFWDQWYNTLQSLAWTTNIDKSQIKFDDTYEKFMNNPDELDIQWIWAYPELFPIVQRRVSLNPLIPYLKHIQLDIELNHQLHKYGKNTINETEENSRQKWNSPSWCLGEEFYRRPRRKSPKAGTKTSRWD